MRTFLIITLLSIACTAMASPQRPQTTGGGRRPVLVDDIRMQPLYQTEVVKDWKNIPHLSSSQQDKINEINSNAKKKLIGISQTLTHRMSQLEVLYAKDPTNAKAIGNKEREIIKLEEKLNNVVSDSRKKIRKLLDEEQIDYIDSTNW